MERFFNVRGEWSKPLKSITGVPEGCPLSVVMMALVTWAFTGALAAKFPGRILHSYVDDWTIRDHDPDHLIGQMSYIQEIADKVGLKLSMPKSTMYATSGPARKKLAQVMAEKGIQLEVHDSGKGLGVDFQARGRKVTATRSERVAKALPSLNKLRVMPWPSHKKAAVLTRGIFPALLYGCEFHDMGGYFFRDMRTLCNKTIWPGKQYMSHYLSPILSTRQFYEPWIWVLRRCYTSFARALCMQPDLMKEVWNAAIVRPAGKHTLGPITILVAHLSRLGSPRRRKSTRMGRPGGMDCRRAVGEAVLPFTTRV